MDTYKLQLATTEDITTTYAGQDANKYISAALFSADSITNGAVSVRPNIKLKEVISKLDLSGLLKDRTCNFADTGTITLGERILTPKELSVQLELCKKNYRSTWMATQMGFSAHDHLAPTFAAYLTALVVASVSQSIETSIWSGVTATAGEFGGLEVVMTTEASQPTAQEIAGTTLSASNIIAELEKVVDQIPKGVYGKPDLNILFPTTASKFYIQSQAALGYRDLFHDGTTRMNFQGVNLITCPGMSNDVMFGAQRSNLFYGVGELNDQSEVRVIDRAATEGDDNVRIVMDFAAGTQVGKPEDIVTYGITNGSN